MSFCVIGQAEDQLADREGVILRRSFLYQQRGVAYVEGGAALLREALVLLEGPCSFILLSTRRRAKKTPADVTSLSSLGPTESRARELGAGGRVTTRSPRDDVCERRCRLAPIRRVVVLYA